MGNQCAVCAAEGGETAAHDGGELRALYQSAQGEVGEKGDPQPVVAEGGGE